MGIKVLDTSTHTAGPNFPFMWRDSTSRVFVRRADSQDVCLTSGVVTTPKASDIEAWSLRVTQVTLIAA